MSRRIFRAILLAASAVLLAVLAIVTGCLYDYYRTVQEEQLKDELRLAAYAVETGGRDYLEKLAAPDPRYPWTPDYRLTWVAPDGTVLFDTVEPARSMENHGNRAEIREALAAGEGRGVRYSDTLTERTLYRARALNDGTVLRISISQATAPALALVILRPVLLVAVMAAVLSAALARRMSRKIVQPLDSLDLDHPLENDTYEELTPLLRRISHQRQQITAQLQSLRAKADELTQITRHMNEGLVLLDNSGSILSINPAAQRIFGVEAPCAGQPFLTLDTGRGLESAVRAAWSGGHSELRAQRNGREFQFDASRIESDGAVIGMVLLAFDVTEQARAERSRREFTANVSHELKTPLQSILGSAELLGNGVVRQEDVPRFASLIHKEAARLVALVEDIIHLSQLDEGAELPREAVDLLGTANSVAGALREQAARKNVTISTRGESVRVNGVRGFLYELIYNLCDNAIKYNREDGAVEISVSGGAHWAAVSVRDTGIGIPAEYQSSVFERFFRVDKSRSKASGGTGLGLSIVKHIAQYHHASIELQSEEGKGTAVRVEFPLPSGGAEAPAASPDLRPR